MKEFTLMLLLCLGLAACKNDNQSTDTPNTDEQNTEVAADPNETASDYVPKSKEEEFLLTNFWVFEFYIVPNDHPASVEKRGTWYAFSPDGTYEMGHWAEQTGKGTWTLFQDENKWKVRCDAEDDSQDAEWELQFNQDGDVASWIGTSVYPSNKGVMGKVINLMTRPTKKQFGYE
jgi:hypothetical protein